MQPISKRSRADSAVDRVLQHAQLLGAVFSWLHLFDLSRVHAASKTLHAAATRQEERVRRIHVPDPAGDVRVERWLRRVAADALHPLQVRRRRRALAEASGGRVVDLQWATDLYAMRQPVPWKPATAEPAAPGPAELIVALDIFWPNGATFIVSGGWTSPTDFTIFALQLPPAPPAHRIYRGELARLAQYLAQRPGVQRVVFLQETNSGGMPIYHLSCILFGDALRAHSDGSIVLVPRRWTETPAVLDECERQLVQRANRGTLSLRLDGDALLSEPDQQTAAPRAQLEQELDQLYQQPLELERSAAARRRRQQQRLLPALAACVAYAANSENPSLFGRSDGP